MPRRYGNWLRGYLELCADSEAPNKFHLWTGISTIAGALRRRVWIEQHFFQWVPNFYILLIGPPGIVTKSTTIAIGHGILQDVEGVRFGPQIITWQALAQSLAEATELVEVSPGEFIPMSAITISVSELGTFLDTSEPQMMDLLTDLWDGKKGTISKATKTQGTDIMENPWVNFIGCTTPSWLRRNIDENTMTGGLASRIIWLYADTKRHLVAYPATRVSVTFAQRRKWLLEDLEAIAELVGEIKLSAAAIKWGTNWYTDHYAQMKALSVSDATSGLIARAQTHIHKLAMIFSVAEGDTLMITEAHLQAAYKTLQAVEQELPFIYGLIQETPNARLAAEIRHYIASNGTVSITALFQKFWTRGWADFRTALESVLQGGYAQFDGTYVRKK